MVGLKEMCALLLAGGMGAGSVVAVQQAKPGIARPKPAVRAAPKPRVTRARAPDRPSARLDDCPVTAAPLASAMALAPLPAEDFADLGSLLDDRYTGPVTSPGDGGFGIPGGGAGPTLPPAPPPVVPGVPEPAAWAMMVSGFGLIAVALRAARPRPA